MSWDSKVQNLLGHCTSEAAFGAEVQHIPAVGATQLLQGIWSDVYLSVNPEDGVQVMSAQPNIGARLSDFVTAPNKGDIMVRSGQRYIIRAVEPDGEGGVTLVLEKEV